VKYLIPLLLLLLVGCGPSAGGGSNNDPPPPPPGPDYTEQEPNDDFIAANFITLLPLVGNTETIGGHTDQYDADFFLFFLNPNPGVTEIPMNIVVETEFFFLAPKVRLYQTIYNDLGVPTGDHQLLGQFVGTDGELIILDWPVPYDSFYNNDLFVVLESFGPGQEEYELEFWTW